VAMSYRNRKRLALLALLIGLPTYVAVTAAVVARFGRPDLFVELLVYVLLGIAWILPLRPIFRGIGQPDPAAAESGARGRDGGA